MMKSVPINRLRGGLSLQSKIHVQVSPKEIHFRAGQIFQGKVVRARVNGFVLVTMGGKTLKARTSIPLREGKSYSFLVRTVRPRIELKVIREEDSNPISAGKLWVFGQKDRLQFTSLLRDLAFSHSLKNLKDLFPLLLYQGPVQEDATWLFRNLLSSGIFWENKVVRHLLFGRANEPVATLTENDLKGVLLSMKKEMEHSASQSREMQLQMGRIDRLLSLLENNQALNLDALREGWGWYWFIAGADQREFLYGELFGKNVESGDIHRLHMNLSFTRLGEIYVDCVLREKGVWLSMQVTSERIGRFLKENISLLEKGIEKQGLVVTRLACKVVPHGSPFNPFSEEKSASALMDMVI